MRPDLFFCGAVFYRVALCDAPLLFELFQAEIILPKGLKKHPKHGAISFFLSYKYAAVFERVADARALAFSRTEKGLHVLGKRAFCAPGMLVGIFLALLLFAGARTVVWDIRITGTERVENAEIEQALEELGLFRGAFLSALDADGFHSFFSGGFDRTNRGHEYKAGRASGARA